MEEMKNQKNVDDALEICTITLDTAKVRLQLQKKAVAGDGIALPKYKANVNVDRSMWLFKHKFHADGSLSKYKTRLVANGRSQQQGNDCDESFSPVVKPATIRTVLSMLFLCSLYRLKQAPRVSFLRFACWSDIAYLLLYVDDIILTASSAVLLQCIIDMLHSEFAMTDLGSVNYFLGISAQQLLACFVLGPDGDPDSTLYRSIAGALQYLTFTRADLSYLHVSSTQLTSYTDVDWAGYPVNRRSTLAEYHRRINVVAESAWICTIPLDTAKVRLQLQKKAVAGDGIALPKYKGMLGTVGTIAKEEGLASLWKGIVPGLHRQCLFGGLRIGLYEPVRSSCFFISRALAISVANPTDLVKVRLQAEGKLAPGVPRRYSGALSYKHIHGVWRKKSWAGEPCEYPRNKLSNG
ncbi:mitochondrial uncoupling protein 1-like protein [Tanacetum coccineum]